MRLLLVIAGGGIGSAARYLAGTWLATSAGTGFPWGTLLVNVAGSFLIGLIATRADELGLVTPPARALLVVGVLGGFTTFSSLSLETYRLFESGDLTRAAANVAGNLVLGGVGVALGVSLGRAV